jgi:hypothetical protein
VPPVYALNLFDLAANDDYLAYQRALKAVDPHGIEVVALGTLAADGDQAGDTPPRQAMILVQWPSRAVFDAFLVDPDHEPLHHLRENGTQRYLWWLYDRVEDLRPLLNRPAAG